MATGRVLILANLSVEIAMCFFSTMLISMSVQKLIHNLIWVSCIALTLTNIYRYIAHHATNLMKEIDFVVNLAVEN